MRMMAVVAVGVALLVGSAWTGWSIDWRDVSAYVLAFVFGTAIGAAELVARYRDRPAAALGTDPAAIYMSINGAAALAAFWLLHTHRLELQVGVFGQHQTLNALVLGGFGAMALFRTSVFNVRVGDTSVAVGPAAMLQVILRAADRETDRLRAGPRAITVGKIMRNVIYGRAREALPYHCFALMQNLTLEEQNGLEQALAVLDKKESMGDEAKSYSLGLLLMNVVGEDVLGRAVAGLGERIKGPPPDKPPVLFFAKELRATDLPPLLQSCRALVAVPNDPAVAADADLIVPEATVTKEADQIVIALIKLRRRFGPETVSEAITSLLNGRSREASGDEQQDEGSPPTQPSTGATAAANAASPGAADPAGFMAGGRDAASPL